MTVGKQRSEETGSFVAVLRNRNFLLLWVAQLISNVGDAFAAIAVLVFITDKSESATAISSLMLVQLIPMVLVGPIIGVFVDKWDRKKLLIGSDIVRAGLYLVVALRPQTPVVYVTVFFAAIASLFFSPARGAVIPALVSDRELTAAIGLSQTTLQSVQIVGPLLGGAMAGFLGAGAVFTFNAITFVVSAILLQLVAIPPEARFPRGPEADNEAGVDSPARKTLWSDFSFGLRFLRKDNVLWFIVAVLGSFSIIGRFSYVGHLDYLRNVLVLSAARFGFIMTVTGAGAALGAAIMGNIGDRVHRGRAFYLSFLASAALLTVYFFRPGYELLLAIGFATGLCQSSFHVPLTAIFYSRTPVEVRGRVFSITNSLLNGAGVISLPTAGLVISALGSPLTIALTGLAGVVLLSAALLLPASRELLGEEKASRALQT